MWIFLIPVAVGALSLLSKAKTGSFNPAELLVQHPAGQPAQSPVIGPGNVTPGAQPGLGTVDGHGTGVVAGVPVPPPVAGIPVAGVPASPSDPIAAAAAAAAAQLAAQQSNPTAANNAAATAAAESIRQEMIAALNTPEADRTPEQAALVSGLASLPTI